MPARVATRKVPYLAAPFTPHGLPGLQCLLDARALGGADGSAVTHWPDLSGHGNDGTSGAGLTYHVSGGPNGLPRVAANGTSASLSIAGLTLSPAHTIYALVTPGAATGYKRLLSGTTDNYLFLGVSGTNQLTTLYGNGTTWNYLFAWGLAPNQAAGTYAVVTERNDGSVAATWYNGAPQGAQSNPMTATTGVSLFGPPSSSQWWDGSLCFLAVYNVAHTEAQRLQMEAFLARLAFPVARVPAMALTRYPAINPVVAKAAAWESSDIANPDVTYDTPNSRWMLNYSAFDGTDWRLCLAYSTDLLTWTKDSNNPVASPISGEGNICCNGSVQWMPSASLYYHWYHTASNNGIYLMTSPDLHTWTRHTGNPVLPLGSAGTYDAGLIADLCVRWMPGGTTTLECWYRAIDSGSTNCIARATSTDGITWTRDKAWLSPQPWASVNWGEPSVLRDGSTVRLTYDVATTDGHRNVGEAITPDGGTTWGFQSDFLVPGSAAWEADQCFDSCLLLVGETLYLFYAGSSGFGSTTGMDSQIGVVTAPYVSGAF